MKIILASKSPRRRELLRGLDIDFEIRLQEGIEENYPREIAVDAEPEYIAAEKAQAYHIADDEILITADTLVIIDGVSIGKPKDDNAARRMLRKLSGRTHQVVTGVCLKTVNEQRSFSVSTDVTFRQLRDDEIDYYVDNYHPLDKAGAYGIQEWIGYVGVTDIHGSYFNVMGFPVQRIYDELQKIIRNQPKG